MSAANLLFHRRPYSSAPLVPPHEDTTTPLPTSAEPLGRPLPLDEHACSVSLPTWDSVVGYEEGNVSITSKLRCGYPRFVYHPYILQLKEYAVEQYGNQQQDCLILPSADAAARCQAFMHLALHGKATIDNALVSAQDMDDVTSQIATVALANDVHAVLFPAETLAGMEAKAYWQHTGEVVSSRRAEAALHELGLTVNRVTTVEDSKTSNATPPRAPIICHPSDQKCPSVYDKLKERISSLTKVPPSYVHLVPSGMASIYTALRSSRRLKGLDDKQNGGTSIVFGFPYLDTLKLCSRTEFCPGGVEFFGHGDADDLNKLQQLLSSKQKDFCALFTEVPSNPLLQTPNVSRLRDLATEHKFSFVVDDTIGNFLNVNLLGEQGADVLCTSLTKLFSGRGDAMAGSLVVNPETDVGQQMQSDLVKYHDQTPGLFSADAWALYHNAHDFEERNDVINETAEQLADWLKEHESVAKVWYPKYTSLYSQVATGRGYGGLLSLHLQSHICQRTFFDALDVSKGPSLGTNFTLACPYTLLAHYHELDFAMEYNVMPNLLRVAIGLEPFEVLKDRFESAFDKSRLHPPLPKQSQRQRRMYSTNAVKQGLALTKRLVR